MFKTFLKIPWSEKDFNLSWSKEIFWKFHFLLFYQTRGACFKLFSSWKIIHNKYKGLFFSLRKKFKTSGAYMQTTFIHKFRQKQYSFFLQMKENLPTFLGTKIMEYLRLKLIFLSELMWSAMAFIVVILGRTK